MHLGDHVLNILGSSQSAQASQAMMKGMATATQVCTFKCAQTARLAFALRFCVTGYDNGQRSNGSPINPANGDGVRKGVQEDGDNTRTHVRDPRYSTVTAPPYICCSANELSIAPMLCLPPRREEAMDSALEGSGEEEEADEVVDAVFEELNIDIFSGLQAAPTTAPQAAAAEEVRVGSFGTHLGKLMTFLCS